MSPAFFWKFSSIFFTLKYYESMGKLLKQETSAKIMLAGREIAYTYAESSRTRSIKLTAEVGRGFIVTAPRGISREYVRRFLLQQQHWIFKRISFCESPRIVFHSGLYLEQRDAALRIIEQSVDVWNAKYKFDLSGVFVRNQKTRWGSCSARRNLTFNYKVAYLPDRLREYVVVHELCHLQEFNHSRSFWDLVTQTIPDHALRRKELEKYSPK